MLTLHFEFNARFLGQNILLVNKNGIRKEYKTFLDQAKLRSITLIFYVCDFYHITIFFLIINFLLLFELMYY